MIKIIESEDKNILLDERVALTHQYWKRYGLVPSNISLNGIKDRLINSSENFPPKKIWVAKEEEEVLGWLSISQEDKQTLELGRWEPVVKNIAQENVATGLLKKCVEYASNIQNILSCSYSCDKNSNKVFLRYYQNLFIRWGFKVTDEISFMVLDKWISGVNKNFSSDYKIVNINDIETSKISELSYNIFKNGKDRHMRLSKEKMDLEIEKKLSENVIADLSVAIKKNEEVVGFSIVKDRGFDYHIDLIGIKGQFQGLGLGTYLINLAVEKLSTKDRRITLGADKLNREAKKFYRKLGFAERHIIVTLERNTSLV
ncbi:MAG: GNAT family N-acetyltransferase [Candidatus Heimdallarchaeota archaeon]|nr:GNAT family N-acetyltransferase [Candidatus Heimdallarchaeota archaeon]